MAWRYDPSIKRTEPELVIPQKILDLNESTASRIRAKYGEILTVNELAEVLRYASGASVRKAHSAGRLPVPLKKFPNRRGLFATAESVAAALDELQAPE